MKKIENTNFTDKQFLWKSLDFYKLFSFDERH